MIELTTEECKAVYEIIDMLTGSNPESVFEDDLGFAANDQTTTAFFKIFRAAGQSTPPAATASPQAS